MSAQATEHAPEGAQRSRRRRKAALRLLLLLLVPLLLLVSVFSAGVYWGSTEVPLALLEKEESWLGWKVKPHVKAAAQRIHNRRHGLGGFTVLSDSVPIKPEPTELMESPKAPAKMPKKQPEISSGAPTLAQANEPRPEEATEAAKPEKAPQPRENPAVEAGSDPRKKPGEVAAVPEEPPGELPAKPAAKPPAGRPARVRDLPSLAEAKAPSPAAGKELGANKPQTVKARFDLPAKVGVMLIVDSQAFPGQQSCQRARSALHGAGVYFREWLNLSLDARGCLPWEAKSEKTDRRGEALVALDLPGTDLLLVLSRPGRISLPQFGVETDLFNTGLTIAELPGGADDAALRRSMMHAVGRALGAEPLRDATSPDARRGSIMSDQPEQRRDWLDEKSRWRMLERKHWPFRRGVAAGGQR